MKNFILHLLCRHTCHAAPDLCKCDAFNVTTMPWFIWNTLCLSVRWIASLSKAPKKKPTMWSLCMCLSHTFIVGENVGKWKMHAHKRTYNISACEHRHIITKAKPPNNNAKAFSLFPLFRSLYPPKWYRAECCAPNNSQLPNQTVSAVCSMNTWFPFSAVPFQSLLRNYARWKYVSFRAKKKEKKFRTRTIFMVFLIQFSTI